MMDQPRPVKLRTIYETARMWPGLFQSMPTYLMLFLFGFPFSIWATAKLYDGDIPDVDYDRIKKEGTITSATVLAIEPDNDMMINGKYPSIISYRYSTQGKETKSKFKTLDDLGDLAEGDEIEVKYLNDQSIIIGFEQDSSLWSFIAMPIAFFILPIIPISILGYLVGRKIKLYKYGSVTQAQLLSVVTDGEFRLQLFFKRPPISRIEYQYTGPSGRTYVELAKSNDRLIANTLKQGDTIRIFVSPDDESKSALIPKGEAIRNNWKID